MLQAIYFQVNIEFWPFYGVASRHLDIECIHNAGTLEPWNPVGTWNPKKIMDMLDWVKANYPCDTTRVYVLGMSLGGYGTMDVCGTYPDRIAAGMALCGGTSLKDVSGLGKLPFCHFL